MWLLVSVNKYVLRCYLMVVLGSVNKYVLRCCLKVYMVVSECKYVCSDELFKGGC